MIEPLLPVDEQDRLHSLCSLHLLDTPPEERFDRITRLAAALFDVPIALVSLLDDKRQWFKSRYGLEASHTARSISFCGHAITDGNVLIVPDTLLDPRFVDNPLVTGAPYIRFYAGLPISSPDGFLMGTLCAIDTRPRAETEIYIESLRDLAKLVEEEIGKSAVAHISNSRKEQLAIANHQLSAHLDNSPLAVVEWDHTFKVSKWSDLAQQIFGWQAEDVIGKHPHEWQFVHEEDRHLVDILMSELLNKEQPRNTSRNRIYCKDGTVVHCVWYNSILFGDDGTPISILSLIQNITENVEAEYRLIESEERFRATFEQAAVGIAHVGLDGSWLKVNQKLCAIIGYSAEEVRLLSFQDITHPEDLSVDLSFLQEILNGQRITYSLEKRYIHKNGDIIWVNLTVSLKKDSGNLPEYFISVIEDIRTRKKAEFALQNMYGGLEILVKERTAALIRSNEDLAIQIEQRRQAEAVVSASEERLRTIIKSSQDAFIGVDSQGSITDWNDAAETTFGWTLNEIVGKNVADLIFSSPQGSEQKSQLAHFFASDGYPTKNQHVELVALTRSGDEFPVEVSMASYQVDGAQFLGAFVHDISERKYLAQQLEQKQQLLDTVLETIDVAVIACSGNGELTLFNRTAREYHGLNEESIPQEQWAEHYDLYAADGKTLLQREDIPLIRALQGECVQNVEMVIAPRYLKARTLLASGKPLVSSAGEKLGAVIAMHDISQRKEVEQQLNILARIDSLTGLLNRRSFNEKLNEASVRSSRTAQPIALMFLDIDHFKSINDSLGHAVGDDVLKEFAQRIKASVRVTDAVSRLGGDEFTIILEGIPNAEEAAFVGGKILEAIRKPFLVHGHKLSVTTSIGIALLNLGEDDLYRFTIKADDALYAAKGAGRNQFAIY